ncbi:hypothetical protein D3C80_1212400 [compost metagenome]
MQLVLSRLILLMKFKYRLMRQGLLLVRLRFTTQFLKNFVQDQACLVIHKQQWFRLLILST